MFRIVTSTSNNSYSCIFQAFIEWKSHIKAKIRSNKILSDTEKECADSMGLMVASTGISNVPELGLGKKIGKNSRINKKVGNYSNFSFN